MSNFLNDLKNNTNYTTTENGAITHKTSNSHVVDYFAQGSSLRHRNYDDIISLFTKSFSEDKLLTMKILFYSRDVRGGQGERETFRKIINYLADNHPDVVKKNIHLIAEFGRWDDLYSLFGTALEKDAIKIIKDQLEEDMKAECPSLLGKWLKSENTSSEKSRKLAKKTRLALGMTPRQYRKTLTSLRKKINIIETLISEKRYDEIDYSKIPSKAGMIYRNAFVKNDYDRYNEFLEKANTGEVKVNSSTLYPYEIVRNLLEPGWDWNYARNQRIDQQTIKLMEAMWANLPDYVKDSKVNGIVVADTSGSMDGTPIQIAVSLAIYLAERNKGTFKDNFITFSNRPELQEIIGSNLYEKVNNLVKADWGGSTNIEAVFDLILETAIKNHTPQEDLPSTIFIVSDMEFDDCSYPYGEKSTLFHYIEGKFINAGYKIPKLVFWNVDSRHDNIPMTMDSDGVQLVSGANPVLFETLLNNEFLGAYEIMLKEIGKERYNCITV